MATEFILWNEEILQPTYEEFRNFHNYVQWLDGSYHFNVGFAHIRAPPQYLEEWDDISSRPSNFRIALIAQSITREGDGYLISTNQLKPRSRITVAEYLNRTSSNERDYSTYDEYERQYWSTLDAGQVLYAADIDYSFCKEVSTWNFNRLGSILDDVKTQEGNWVKGIHEPYGYIGNWKSSFGYHTEDSDLHSINFHLSGKPKIWYFVPREHGFRFDQVVSTQFSEYRCDKFLRHKMCIFGQDFFIKNKIKRIRVVQNPGEIIVTFPYIFHSGFNCGINYNEAVNFGTVKWINYGKAARHCSCVATKQRSSYHVDLNLDGVVKRFQPKQFKDWKNCRGTIYHPDDPHVEETRQFVKARKIERLADNVQHRFQQAALPRAILSLYVRFLIDNNFGLKSEKGVRKFKKHARGNRNVKIPALNDSTLLSRLTTQIKSCLSTGDDTLDLTENEICIVKQKI